MGLDAQDKLLFENLQAKFQRKDEPAEIQQLGAIALNLARMILELCPAARERDIAVNHIEDAIVYARTAIASQKGHHE